jgi:hypothetical protein
MLACLLQHVLAGLLQNMLAGLLQHMLAWLLQSKGPTVCLTDEGDEASWCVSNIAWLAAELNCAGGGALTVERIVGSVGYRGF